jgi:DNA-binding SARP family transcriptional activator
MWLGILGPLTVTALGERDVPIGAAKQRAILGALALEAGRVVSLRDLADSVWDGEPPANAQTALRTYVARLRQTLGSELGAMIRTAHGGYVLSAGEQDVDALMFERLCRSGQAFSAAGDWRRAAEDLHRALALWRGSPLSDAGSNRLRCRAAGRWEEPRLQALQTRIEADLRLGRHQRALNDLCFLTSRFPLHEPFYGQLMIAYFRSDRRGEALRTFQHARTTLLEKVGIEPGRQLYALRHRIMNSDPALLSAQSPSRDPRLTSE